MKTKQEAIQEQIDEIMDTFDFKQVEEMMRAVGWTWGEEGVSPLEWELRGAARTRLLEAAKKGYSSTGGFSAVRTEGVDDDGPWIMLNLQFGPKSLNDGTTYDA